MEAEGPSVSQAKLDSPVDMESLTETKGFSETRERIPTNVKAPDKASGNTSEKNDSTSQALRSSAMKDMEMRAQVTIKKKRNRRRGRRKSIINIANEVTDSNGTMEISKTTGTTETINATEAMNTNDATNTIEPDNTSKSKSSSNPTNTQKTASLFKGKFSRNEPKFGALSVQELVKVNVELRKVPVPPHRMTPLRANWMQIYEPIVKHLKLQIRMNLRSKSVELRTSQQTTDAGALQKGHDFVRAFLLGFAIPDAIALVRLDDLYIESFEVKDIRSTLKGDHLARAVGRIAGKDGRTKFTIENATKTRIVVADTKIHILGSYENTRLARHSISSLVLGSAPGKVYNKLRTVSARLNERKF